MSDIVDFPRPMRPELVTSQCSCGSFSFKLQSDRAAVCTECGNEATRVFGFWQIAEAAPGAAPAGRADVIPLRLFREMPEDRMREQMLLEAAMHSPVGRRIFQKGAVTISGVAPPGPDER